MFIDVNITPTETKRLSIFRGDTADVLARDFCELHGLSTKMQMKLLNLLKVQIDELNLAIERNND